MNANLSEPVRSLYVAHGFFSEAYMRRFFPNGPCTKQEAIPKREGPANDASPYDAHRQQGAAA
jgi:hypothetical protein